MRIALSDPRARGAFLFTVLLISAALSYSSAELPLAAAWSSSSSTERWKAAARLEPGNAAYSEKLGLYNEWDLQHRDLAAAERYLELAVQLDPLSAEFHLELASAEEVRGEIAKSREAYEAAKTDYPISADVAWRYGSFLLRQGDTAAGFSEIRRALENDPTLETTAISECWQANPDASAIVQQALPRKSEAYLSALDFFVSQQQTDAARIVWTRLLNLGQPFPMARTLPLVDELINRSRVEDAENVWRQALLTTKWPLNSTSSESLVFNGGFENDALDGGFDWRELPTEGVSFAIENKEVHSGKRALRIDFSGDTNLNLQHLYQYVSVQARRRYRFIAFLRTSNITTDSGIRFQILDPRHPAELQILTPSLTGTNPWTEVEAEVRTPTHTDMLEIILRRVPSEKFDNKLGGTVWVDDVALTPIPAKSARSEN
jgi:tetratricopeptide (TPR) repeat protein